MKYPFNKERAMAGEPVVTRDGRGAKFNHYDKLNDALSFRICDINSNWLFYLNGEYGGPNRERDLFMLTPDPQPSAPIPFDWDKYSSGEWDAVYRKAGKPSGVYFIGTKDGRKVLSTSDKGEYLWHCDNGKYMSSDVNDAYDLLLIPKEVTRWFNVYHAGGCASVGVTYDSERDALSCIDKERTYIGTYSFTTKAKS